MILKHCNGPTSRSHVELEDFDQFYDRFYVDSAFQLSRIQFPLAGESIKGDQQITYTPANWIILKTKIQDIDSTQHEVAYERTDSTFIQYFGLPSSGFYRRYQFEVKGDGKWNLVYVDSSNN